MKILAFSFLLFLFIGQTPLGANAAVLRRASELRLEKGKQATVKKEKLTVKFVSVVEDSRCPEGATCVWQGNAKISLLVGKKGKSSKTVELNTLGRPEFPSETNYLNYKIKLVSLDREGKTAVVEINSTR